MSNGRRFFPSILARRTMKWQFLATLGHLAVPPHLLPPQRRVLFHHFVMCYHAALGSLFFCLEELKLLLTGGSGLLGQIWFLSCSIAICRGCVFHEFKLGRQRGSQIYNSRCRDIVPRHTSPSTNTSTSSFPVTPMQYLPSDECDIPSLALPSGSELLRLNEGTIHI